MDGRPIELIYQNRSTRGKFQLNNRAFERIKEQQELENRKLIVISIVGEYRRGKSFFLNYIIKYLLFGKDNKDWMECKTPNDGFKWQGGSTRCTDGIIMWSHAIPFGDEYAVILLDNEGNYDEESTMEKMTQLFGCSAMISSLQIFNVFQRITMQTMHEVQFFAEFGRQANANKRGNPFQKLLFLIRDWEYANETDFGLQGGAKILEHWLKSNNDVRRTLQMCYNDTSCYLMPHPGHIVAKALQDIQVKDFNNDFKIHLQNVIELIFSPRMIKSSNIGENCLRLVDFPPYFKLIANTMLKCETAPKSLYQAQVHAGNMHAYESALGYYNNLMKESLNKNYPIEDLEEIHEKHSNSALDVFDTTPKFGGNSLAAKSKKDLLQSMTEWYEKYKNENALKQMFKDVKNDKDVEILKLNIELMKMKYKIKFQKEKCDRMEENFEKEKELCLSISEIDIKQKENEIKSLVKLKNQEIELLRKTFKLKELHLKEENTKLRQDLDLMTSKHQKLKIDYLKKSENFCCFISSGFSKLLIGALFILIIAIVLACFTGF